MAETNEFIKELLLKDYDYYAENYRVNEETGEKRLTFFITLVTAVTGAVITLYTNATIAQHMLGKDVLNLLVLLSLSGLLVVGLIIYLRLLKRNIITDSYKHKLDHIRLLIKTKFDSDGLLAGYLANRKIEDKRNAWLSLNNRSLTSLSTIVFCINSFIVAFTLIIYSVAFNIDKLWMIVVPGVGLIVGLQALLKRMLFKRVMPTHAGGVVYRKVNGVTEFLIVTSKKNVGTWVLPKGHIEWNETEQQAAVREVMEETGMRATVELKIGHTDLFRYKNESIRIVFYLMKFEEVVMKSAEERGLLWLPLDAAMAKLAVKEQRKILQQLK